MRLNINLASQPYLDARRILLRWGFATVALVLLTCALLFASTNAVIGWWSTNRQTKELRNQITKLNQEKTIAEAVLNQPQNRNTRDQSQFINALIARKAFSWTQVLADLEQIMPKGIRVLSIKPEINDRDQLELRLSVGVGSRERAIELVRRMEGTKYFFQPQVLNEVNQPQEVTDKLRFDISAVYVPSFQREGSNAGH